MSRMLFLLFFSISTSISMPASAEDNDYIYCQSVDDDIDVIYFSGVFLGDYGRSTRYKIDFHNYLTGAMGYEPSFSRTYCFFESSESHATSRMHAEMAEDRGRGYSIQVATWSP